MGSDIVVEPSSGAKGSVLARDQLAEVAGLELELLEAHGARTHEARRQGLRERHRERERELGREACKGGR